MPPISVLIKPASGLCNMRCKYCFYADEMAKRNQASYVVMNERTLENVIREIFAYAEGQCNIAFQGGEPTLAGLNFFRKCLEMEKQYNKKQVKVSYAIQTNGYTLNSEWCEFFYKNHFLVGLSVDGIKATHDAFRRDMDGNDTFFHTLDAAEMLAESKVDFNILTVVNRKTAPKIRRIYKQYQRKGFHWQQYIACLDPIGEKQGQQEFSLTPELYGQFLIDLFDLWESDFRQGRQPYIRQFENYIAVLMGLLPEACENRGICSCQNVIEADGSVYPCDFYVLDAYQIGNLNQEGLETIQKRAQKFIQKSYCLPPKCKECPYHALCHGGCRRHREQPCGEDGVNYFCESYQMFFRTCMPRMRTIADWCRWNNRISWT